MPHFQSKLPVFRIPGRLVLPFALMLGACGTAEQAEQPMDAGDIPENQGMGGAYDGNPVAPTGTGADTAINDPVEDRSSADGTTPLQQPQ